MPEDDGRQRRSKRLIPGILILVVMIALAWGIDHYTQDEVTFTVADKDRVYKSSSQSSRNGATTGHYVYVVKSEEGETFKNTSNYFTLKFRSRPLQDSLSKGERYTCKVSGLRSLFPEFLSRGEGRNLNSCKPAE